MRSSYDSDFLDLFASSFIIHWYNFKSFSSAPSLLESDVSNKISYDATIFLFNVFVARLSLSFPFVFLLEVGSPPVVTGSGVRRKFPRGGNFCHNRVTSQINLGEVPKARPF